MPVSCSIQVLTVSSSNALAATIVTTQRIARAVKRAFDAPGILIAQVLAFTPIAFLVLIGVVEGVSPSMEEAAQTLRANRWQVDLIVVPVQNMIIGAQRGTAVATGGRLGRHQLIGIRRQRTTTAFAPQTGLARAVPLDPGRAVRLLPLRRWHARIARRLRRLVQRRLQRDHPRGQRLYLRPQRMDQRIFLLVRKLGKVRQRRRLHPQAESILRPLVNQSLGFLPATRQLA